MHKRCNEKNRERELMNRNNIIIYVVLFNDQRGLVRQIKTSNIRLNA